MSYEYQINEKELAETFADCQVGIKNGLRQLIRKRRTIMNHYRWYMAETKKEYHRQKDAQAWVRVWHDMWHQINDPRLREVNSGLYQNIRILALIQPEIVKNLKFDPFAVQRAKEIPVESLINQLVVVRGDRITAICPLHKEKTGSFMVFKKNNSWYCFGCHKGGSVIDLVMALYGMGFKEAVKFLNHGG